MNLYLIELSDPEGARFAKVVRANDPTAAARLLAEALVRDGCLPEHGDFCHADISLLIDDGEGVLGEQLRETCRVVNRGGEGRVES